MWCPEFVDLIELLCNVYFDWVRCKEDPLFSAPEGRLRNGNLDFLHYFGTCNISFHNS